MEEHHVLHFHPALFWQFSLQRISQYTVTSMLAQPRLPRVSSRRWMSFLISLKRSEKVLATNGPPFLDLRRKQKKRWLYLGSKNRSVELFVPFFPSSVSSTPEYKTLSGSVNPQLVEAKNKLKSFAHRRDRGLDRGKPSAAPPESRSFRRRNGTFLEKLQTCVPARLL